MKQQSTLDRWKALRNQGKATISLSKRPTDQPVPLAYGQQRLWLLQQLYPDNAFYHYAETYRIRGELQPDQFQAAFQLLVERHDILRTSFHQQEGLLKQQVHEAASFHYRYEDLSQQTERLDEHLQAEARRAFDLSQGPLTRLAIFKLDTEEWVVQFCLHHIITDKWSMRILREELTELYQKLINGQAATLPPLDIQYHDYAYWQQKQAVNKEELNWWKEQLAGPLPILELPTDFKRPDRPSYRGHYHERQLSKTTVDGLRALSREAGVTLFVLLLTAYKLLLRNYSGSEDILVGTPITNRDRSQLEQLIGFFNETVVLRTDLTGNPSFRQLLERVKQTTFAAFSHKNTPFEVLVKELQPERQANINPIFQQMFILHKVPPMPELTAGVPMQPEPLDLGVTKFDLTLYISDNEEELHSLFEYASDLFKPATIERMQDHLHELLASIVDQPDTPVQELSWISKKERYQLQEEWSKSPAKSPDYATLVQQFEAIAQEKPLQLAASFKSETLTYAELEKRSRLLAQALQEQQLETNQLIGLHCERSLDLIVGIWAILRAGAAYVPLDPDYPAERLDYMIRDAGLSLLLSNQQYTTTAEVTVLDFHTQPTQPTADWSSAVAPDQLAYMIYTSGSSGQPKGVPIQHRQLTHSTAARTTYYREKPESFLLLSSFSFDSSVAGIFWATSSGGELVIAPKRIEQDLDQLKQLIQSRQVSHTLLLPSLYATLIQHLDAADLASLNSVIVAGEACPPSLAEQHFNRLPNCRLFNEYGPTEAAVWCSVYELQPIEKGITPIGRPIPNAELLVLNAEGQLLPVAVAGELYVGGAGLAQGYWQRPELSAQRFVEHPFQYGQKLYRTGDMVKWRPDGQLLFMGRVDEQVKIRGHRIELEEISNLICTSAGVTDAAVIATDQQRLAAYIVGNDWQESQLRQLLQRQLPGYMVPTYLLPIDQLPRLPNGKLNKQQLPTPQLNRDPSSFDSNRALSPLEKQLLDIWREVLQQDQLGVDDNFFALGGDSILSIQIVARARRAGIALSPTAIFDHQTISELALFSTIDSAAVSPQAAIEIKEGALLPIQHWFFEEHQQVPHFWNQAYRFSLPPTITIEVLEAVIPAVVQKHPNLQVRFQRLAGKWKSELHSEPLQLQKFDLSEVPENDQESGLQEYLTHAQESRRLDDPLFQLCYFDLGSSTPHQLLLIAHHLIIDAVSWSILLADLNTACRQNINAEPIDLGQATTNYLSWASLLQEWAKAEKFTSDLAFWQAQNSNHQDEAQDNLPYREGQTRTLTGQLGPEWRQHLQGAAHEAFGTNTEELLLTALLIMLQELNGPQPVTVSIEQHGREPLNSSLDFSQSTGWFTSAFPLRLQLPVEAAFDQQIMRIKEQRRAVPNKGLSYGVLRYLSTAAGLDQQPQIFFNYLGQQTGLALDQLGSGHFVTESMRHPESERYRRWEFNAELGPTGLMIHWTYCPEVDSGTNISHLLQRFTTILQELIDFCLQRKSTAYTPSDFPDADLNQDELDNLLGQLDL